MSGNPLISVIIPSFQQGRFIEYALRSLIAQAYEPLEILVMDGGSTDETLSILRAYSPPVTWQSRPDRGQSDALARGFQEARGRILGWLNADDMLLPGALAHAVQVFAAHPSAGAVYGNCVFVDEQGQFLRYFSGIRSFDRKMLTSSMDFIAQPACFFTREAYDTAGGIDPELHFTMDWDLWCRMAARATQFHQTDRLLAATRMYVRTKTASGGWRRLREILAINRRHNRRRLPLGFLGHLYSDHLKRHVWARSLVQAGKWIGGPIWRMMIRARYGENPRLYGMHPGTDVATLPCSIRFPWYRPLRRLELDLKIVSPERPAGDIIVRLGGEVIRVFGLANMHSPQLQCRYYSASSSILKELAIDIETGRIDQLEPCVIRVQRIHADQL